MRLIARALTQLGADEDALELAANATAITAAIGEVASYPLTDTHGWALDQARERVGPDLAAAAARRGRALPASERAARAIEMAQHACARSPAQPLRTDSPKS